ncbi:Exopolygalacturonate lyase [Lunatimonas lonarensis]|uniref:Exopolygalacturonate lyase n=1 Tax=Lunatimonas lonarensis TaxID=1232681 RepID=R7ZNK7_9BACT|nr:exopolygalacturonate lyase [Lunatimonas lonarensis]EON75695.1 Exopolygalacturonate lyase [Lunatimonas lonarensis]
MSHRIAQLAVVSVVFLFIALFGLKLQASKERKPRGYSSERIAAVQRFAETVLAHASDRFRDQESPLLVDGLSVSDYAPVEWVHEGERWIPSNLANQQNFFRTLVGLSRITGDDRYRQSAINAISYGFKHQQHENGLMYWGGHRFFDLASGRFVGEGYRHEFKFTLPYYELMWEVDPEATTKFIRAFWNAHILDWQTLDMNRHGEYETTMGKLWDHVPMDSPPFFEGDGLTFINAGTDLIYAGFELYQLNGEEGAFQWANHLAKRYVEARHPQTNLGVYQYSKPIRKNNPPASGPLPTTSNYGDRAENQFSADFGEVAKEGYLLRSPGSIYGHNAIIQLQMAERLKDRGTQLLDWTLAGMKAWAEYGYDPVRNHAKPIWADGTDLSGYVIKRDGYYGKAGTTFRSSEVPSILFWSYALAYRLTSDEDVWETLRQMAKGFDLGDLGAPDGKRSLHLETSQSDPLVLFGVLELCKYSSDLGLRKLAEQLGDNIVRNRFHNGLFIPSSDHLYGSINAIEPLALLTLEAMLRNKPEWVPAYNGGSGYFHGPHDGLGRTTDQAVFWNAKK